MVVCLLAPEVVDKLQVLFERVRNAVKKPVLVDRAVRPALGAGTVVGDEHDQGVLKFAALFEEADEPADLGVGVGEEPGVDLGHPGKKALLRT
ncbi:hypothetical protein DSECCO2_362620 [anaerobic digester metagenome]